MVSDKSASRSAPTPIGPAGALLAKAKESIGESDERLEQTIVIIRQWLQKQPHLTYPKGIIALCFINNNFYNDISFYY